MAEKLIYAYGGYTPQQLKDRASVPTAANIAVYSTYIGCSYIDLVRIRNILGAAQWDIYSLATHANVNNWSWFGPKLRSIVSQELVHANPGYGSFEAFAAYNHNASMPTILDSGGPGGSKSYNYEGTTLLVRVSMQLGEIHWTSLSSDITHVYVLLYYNSTIHFVLEYELSTYGAQFVGKEIDFAISADRTYTCEFWFGKASNNKILKFPNFPSYTIYAIYAVPANVEITSVGTIANGIEYDRMNVTVNFTNSGGPGNATIYWEIRNSSNVVVDSGSQLVSFATGSGSRALTGLSYPSAGTGYTLRAKETDDSNWQISNSFNVTT